MKLLMVASVIFASVAAVPLSDAAQSGSSLTRNLRPEGGPMSAEEFGEYFDNRLHRLFAKYEKSAISEEAFTKLMESRPPEDNIRLWKNVNLLRSEAVLKWISEKWKDEDRAKIVYGLIKKFNSHQDTVSIINAGKMADSENARSLAYSLEHYMVMHKWPPNKFSFILHLLKLDQIQDEDVLYADPAFTTWLSFAMKRSDTWRKDVSLVLKNRKGLIGPRSEHTYRGYPSQSTLHYWRKIDQLVEKRNKWHMIVKTKKGLDTESP